MIEQSIFDTFVAILNYDRARDDSKRCGFQVSSVAHVIYRRSHRRATDPIDKALNDAEGEEVWAYYQKSISVTPLEILLNLL